jgi:fructuronate reductase
MKLNDIFSGNYNAAEWEAKGYQLPKFDIKAVREKTAKEPTWVHFGGGNIFRAFPAAILNDALNTGKYDRGVIVAETFDFEVIDKAYAPYNNLSLCVNLCSDGSIEKKVIASVTEALKADPQFEDWNRLVEIFKNPSLQMISFTITEKGYTYNEADLQTSPIPSKGGETKFPKLAMGKVCALLYERWKAGVEASPLGGDREGYPLTVQSMDNCSHNGDKVKAGVFAYAERWVKDGLVPAAFLDYLKDEKKITFPWSMIDKITPRPHEKVKEMLAADGFDDNDYIETEKHTFTAPFVNAEEVQYLVIEDNYTNGRPPLDLGGALYTTRETVDKVETMKVTTCLNPLHTAMSIYGCMLGYTLISAEMADEDLRPFVQKLGYIEAMPVVVDPGVLNPYEFIGAVINRRLPNPFMPDAPQRIAMDTSQKLPIRFGETLKKYIARGLDKSNLVLIPLTLAGYARYLKGIKDDGTSFDCSPDPMLEELQAIVAPLEIGKADQDWSPLKGLYSRKDVFGLDLYEAGLGEQIEGMVKELFAGPGAVRSTLHKYVAAR